MNLVAWNVCGENKVSLGPVLDQCTRLAKPVEFALLETKVPDPSSCLFAYQFPAMYLLLACCPVHSVIGQYYYILEENFR